MLKETDAGELFPHDDRERAVYEVMNAPVCLKPDIYGL